VTVIINVHAVTERVVTWMLLTVRRLVADERGEGVISMGIAVLITAVIGAAMFVGFRLFWEDIRSTIQSWIDSIG
jgi:hypothetical protein